MRGWWRRARLMTAALLGLVPAIPSGSYDWRDDPD